MSGIDNPYWDIVQPRTSVGTHPWDHGGLQVERFNLKAAGSWEPLLDRNDHVGRYAWSIPDPDSIAFVAVHSHADGLVDPMAGTGYWAYVLGQVGVDVVCYDLAPRTNHWHEGHDLWVPVEAMPCHESVTKHPDRTLFLSWPPYSNPAGAAAIRAYEGRKVILIGEGAGGCTGDEDMFDLLDAEWRQVAEHLPVVWWGIHDEIRVYERQEQ